MNSAGIKVVFFDIRDTLGEVDRPGHLVAYKPSTKELLTTMKSIVGLRIGVITNLPDNVTSDMGRKMILEASLSDDAGDTSTIGDYLDPQGIVINHDAGVNKPDPEIFRYAARQMGVDVGECIFVGENLNEVLGAKTAGMQTQLKPCPPGREFAPAPMKRGPVTPTDSGRAFEAMLEHEHLLGERIFDCGAKIVENLKAVPDGQPVPADTYTALGFLVYLTQYFADQVHLKAEEAAIPIAIARGMDPAHGAWVIRHHDMARAYFTCMKIAYERLESGWEEDRQAAIRDFYRVTEAFVDLFRHHAILENDILYPEMGKYFTDTDDSIVLNIIQHSGPSDITPYVAIVIAMEQKLGIPSPT